MSRKLKPQPKIAVAKKQPPRWQRERNISLLIWIIIPLIIVLVLGLVGWWYYDTYVAPWQQAVAKVNDTTIGMRYFVKMLRVYSGGTQDKEVIRQIAPQALLEIEKDELIRQKAPTMNIEVTPEEITERIANDFLALQGNTTLSEMELDEMYQRWLDQIGLSDDEYRQIIKTDLLVTKITEYFKEHEVPQEAEQVHLHFIPLDTEEAAIEVSARLEYGEDFADLAEEYSILDEVKEVRGDMGWVPRGIYPELDEVAFGLGAGNVSEPFSTDQGYYIVKVSETAESRPVEAVYQEILAESEFDNWLQSELEAGMEAGVIESYLNQDKINWAANHV